MTRAQRCAAFVLLAWPPRQLAAQVPADRVTAPATATSEIGVYLRSRELVVLPSYERFRNRGFQYNPTEFGVAFDGDFDGDFRTSEGGVYVGYGLTPAIALGFEATRMDAHFRKSASDPSALTPIDESGVGELHVEGSWRFLEQGTRRPQMFVVTELVLPHDRDKRLIGRSGVALLPALGASREFRWGTLEARTALEYDTDSETRLDWGEWSFLYRRDVEGRLSVSGGFEGQVGGSNNFEEVWFVSNVQLFVTKHAWIRVQHGAGLTPHASGGAPEIGLLIRLPR